MRRQYFDYRPRPQFRAFHRRKERFACIVTHQYQYRRRATHASP
jgi:hypothetical protein